MSPLRDISPNGVISPDVSLTRRRWLKRVAGAFIGGTAATVYYTFRIEPYWVEVVQRPLPVRNLPADLVGRTLIQISDIHIGDAVDDKFLIESFKQVASWSPDIVTFTGDFLTLNRDGSLPVAKMERVLKHFPQGRLATLGILGNHDYGVAWSDFGAGNLVSQIAQDAGITVLRNCSQQVAGLQIFGFDDYWGPNFGGINVLANADLKRPTLVLCHNPDVVDLPVWSGYRGWILSGHTHGGQCKPPFLRPPMLPIKNKRYASGEIRLADGRCLYVNRALGHTMNVRFNVRPEITLFRLASPDSV